VRKRVPIPDDWNEATDGYACVLFCIPNSFEWRSIYYGALYELTWWNKWDPDTGDSLVARDLAKSTLESLCMANCDDIVTALNRIADALAGDGQTTNGLVDVVTKLDEIKQYIDQVETIQNNAVRVLGGVVETVLPGGP